MTNHLSLVPPEDPRYEREPTVASITQSDLINICTMLGFEASRVRAVRFSHGKAVVTVYHHDETGHLVLAPDCRGVLTYEVEIPVHD